MNTLYYVWAGLFFLLFTGCQTATTRVDNSTRGLATHYESADSPGAVKGIGIEPQDIVSASDRMVRDILAQPWVVNKTIPPRIVIDSEYFRNESSSGMNKNLLTDRLRIDLIRAADHKLDFIARHQADATEDERKLEEGGTVTGGTLGNTQPALGYDYRLGGRISSQDMVDQKTGMRSSYFLIVFELVERGSGRIVWGNKYEFRKTALDDIIYR